MDSKRRYLDDRDVVETVYWGLVESVDGIERAVRESLAFAAERNSHLFLTDCEGLHGGGSLVEVYQLAERYPKIPVSRRTREAVVLPSDPTAAEHMKFYETTARNRGFNIKVFTDRDSALQWLAAAD